jgi:hypothetical protein
MQSVDARVKPGHDDTNSQAGKENGAISGPVSMSLSTVDQLVG